MSDWIDVTWPLDDRVPRWPGRAAPEIAWEKRIDRGYHCNVSAWRIGAHTGTHIDAPKHFFDQGRTIDTIPLDTLIGPCSVADLTEHGLSTMDSTWSRGFRGARRVLVKAGFTGNGGGSFTHHPALLSVAAAEGLIDAGLLLLGTDRLSVDDSQGTDFPLHRGLLGFGCVIIEGLNLTDISVGEYELCALPLPMVGAEASPARVLLRRPRALESPSPQ